jgi:hypothetical protein
MTVIPSQYTNQFEQTPVIGQRDLSLLAGSNAMSFQVSPNQATPLLAGAGFVLDTAITTVMGMPQVISCADNVVPLGTVAFTNKAVSFAAGEVIEGLVNLGPVVFMVANDTIVAGATVERTTTFVQTKSAGAAFGIALDPGVQNGFLRVALLASVSA